MLRIWFIFVASTSGQEETKYCADFQLRAQYQYHTEAIMEYMENDLEGFHHPKDVFSRLRMSKSAKKLSEALKSSLLGQTGGT